jgi:hypothetical protein
VLLVLFEEKCGFVKGTVARDFWPSVFFLH